MAAQCKKVDVRSAKAVKGAVRNPEIRTAHAHANANGNGEADADFVSVAHCDIMA